MLDQLCGPLCDALLGGSGANEQLRDLEASNNAWIDLVRYGTRSDLVDFWKSIPMNFFVPWRIGTLTTLLKQAKNHPIRTAIIVGGIDYLRAPRVRRRRTMSLSDGLSLRRVRPSGLPHGVTG